MAARTPSVVLPSATVDAQSSSGVAVLTLSEERRDAQRLVVRFFEAVRKESLSELETVLTDDSTLASGVGGSSQAMIKVWAARFKRLDYRHARGQVPYSDRGIGVFTPDELEQLRTIRSYQLAPQSGQLLAVVEPESEVAASGLPRRFGQRLEFVLSKTDAGLRISHVYEDFRLP